MSRFVRLVCFLMVSQALYASQNFGDDFKRSVANGRLHNVVIFHRNCSCGTVIFHADLSAKKQHDLEREVGQLKHQVRNLEDQLRLLDDRMKASEHSARKIKTAVVKLIRDGMRQRELSACMHETYCAEPLHSADR